MNMYSLRYLNIFKVFCRYNKKNAHIVNTYQNYLKVTKDKIAFEIERCKSLNLCFGIKMVRGAYMVEERALASKYNYEDPIQPTIEATHNNYNSNLEFVMANWIQGSRMIVASHNEHSVNLAKSLIKKYDINQTKGLISNVISINIIRECIICSIIGIRRSFNICFERSSKIFPVY